MGPDVVIKLAQFLPGRRCVWQITHRKVVGSNSAGVGRLG